MQEKSGSLGMFSRLNEVDVRFVRDWRVVMKGRTQLFIVLIVFVLSGCAVKVVDVEYSVPHIEMTEKIPLRVAVLVRESSRSVTTVGSIPASCRVGGAAKRFTQHPFGKIFENASRAVFSQIFADVEIVPQLAVSKSYDLIIEANFDRILNKPGCGVMQNGAFRAEGSLRILDRDLNELWKSTEDANAAEQNYDVGINDVIPGMLSRILSESMSEAIVSLVRQLGQDLKSSLALYKYAKSLQNVQGGASKLSVNVPPALSPSSDVDDVPERRGRVNRKAFAIVIGVEQYRQGVPRAEFAVRDAQTVTEYLTKTLGYPEQNVVMLHNEHASKSDFEKYFEKWLPNNVEKDATVFVFYSGHGAPDPASGGAYLVPYDGDPSFIAETGYSLKRMYSALGNLPAREVIVALDSCFSGAGGRSVIAKGARPLVMRLQNNAVLPKNMTVLSASSGEQISSTYDEKGHGLFTYFMLKGIKNEDVVRQDGSLDFSSLYDYVKPQVTSVARKKYNNEQTPQLTGATK